MPAAQNEADRVAEDANAATLLRSRTSEIVPAGRDQVAAPAEAAVPVDPAAVGWNKQKDRTTRRDRGVAGSRELASAVRQAQEASGALPSPKLPAALAQPSPPRPVGPRAPQPQPPSRVARLVVGLASVGAVALAIGLYAMWPPSKVEAPPPPLVVARPASIEVPVKADPVTPPAPDPAPPLRLAPHPEPAASPGPPVDPSPHPEPATGKVVAKGPAPAPANKKTGTLVVYVKPWVHAWVDAEPFTGAADQEAAPRLSRSLASGKHQVHLRDGMGHERQVEVNITPDHSITVDGVFEKLAVH
jgi:hypothetical protein